MQKLLDYTPYCDSIAWDGCHKIYILMDGQQTEKMREYGYEHIVTAQEGEDLFGIVESWYDDSCGLRFVSAIETDNTEEDSARFTAVYAQFETVD